MKNKYFLKIITMTTAFIISMPVWSGEAEWQNHMKTVNDIGKTISSGIDLDINKNKVEGIELHLKSAIKEAEGFNKDDPRLAQTLYSLADIYYKLDRYQEAEPYAKRAVELSNHIKEKPLHIMFIKRLLADIYYNLNRHQEAEPLYDDVLSFYANNKADHAIYQYSFTLQRIAENYSAQGKHKKAEIALKQAIKVQNDIQQLTPSIPNAHTYAYLPLTLMMLGRTYRAQEQFKEAEEAFKTGINMYVNVDKVIQSIPLSLEHQKAFEKNNPTYEKDSKNRLLAYIKELLDLYSLQGKEKDGAIFIKDIEKATGYKLDKSKL